MPAARRPKSVTKPILSALGPKSRVDPFELVSAATVAQLDEPDGNGRTVDGRCVDGWGSTALYWAAHGGMTDVVTALLAAGAGAGAVAWNEAIPGRVMWFTGDTPLHAACSGGHVAIARALLAAAGADADVNALDRGPTATATGFARTPLLRAAAKASATVELLGLLLSAGADPELSGKHLAIAELLRAITPAPQPSR